MPASSSSQRGDGLTTTETRLAEQYVSVLDYVSRCALGIERGDWFYLYDKAGALVDEAERLAVVAREAYDGPRRPRAQAVRAAVAWFGRHYRAARLLHPLEPTPGGVSGGDHCHPRPLAHHHNHHPVNGGTAMHTPVPWIGLAAIAAMFLLPWLDARGVFDGPRTIRRRPRREVCADCANPWDAPPPVRRLAGGGRARAGGAPAAP